jgi:hypothetical protein
MEINIKENSKMELLMVRAEYLYQILELTQVSSKMAKYRDKAPSTMLMDPSTLENGWTTKDMEVASLLKRMDRFYMMAPGKKTRGMAWEFFVRKELVN